MIAIENLQATIEPAPDYDLRSQRGSNRIFCQHLKATVFIAKRPVSLHGPGLFPAKDLRQGGGRWSRSVLVLRIGWIDRKFLVDLLPVPLL